MAEIIVSNKMSTIYELKAYKESNIDVDITVGVYTNSDIDVEIGVRGTGISDIPVLLNVVYSGQSEIPIEVQPIIHSEIEVDIEVNPVNRMSVIYELIEPTTIQVPVTAIQDTFVSSQSPYNVVNFGENNSMKVGNDSFGNNISYVKFDINDVPLVKVIKSAKLRINYTSYNDTSLTINEVNFTWSELGLTNENKGSIVPINATYTVNKDSRYIEFDVTDSFLKWYQGLPNNGLAITSNDTLTLFRTRESGMIPTLYVEYYSDDIYSVNTSLIPIEVTVVGNVDSTIDVEVEVLSQYSNSEILVDVLAHQKEDIIISEILTFVEVLGYESASEILVDVTATMEDSSKIDVEVVVIEYESESEIEVDVTVVNNGNSEIDVEVEVLNEQQSYIDVEVEVDSSNIQLGESEIQVDFEISDGIANNEDYSEILVTLEVVEKDTLSEILVEVNVYDSAESTIDVEVEVPFEEDESFIDVEVFVNIKDGESEIPVLVTVVEYGDAIIDVEVYARVLGLSQVNVEVEVTNDIRRNIYCYII